MTAKEKHKAQLVLVCGFTLLYLVFRLNVFLFIAIGASFIFLFIPLLGDLLLKGWFKLAEMLGWLNSRILLTLVFVLFVVPLAAIRRIFGRNSLKLNNQNDSLFSERNHRYTPEDLKNLW